MFTGIIETLATLVNIEKQNTNTHFYFQSNITNQLKIDQSIAHNGVCLTVVDIKNDVYKVTAIDETLKKTNLSHIKINDQVNLERCLMANSRLDGHIVQGHVDQSSECILIEDKNGSWNFHFEITPTNNKLIVNKGSICINGVSLTIVDCSIDTFSVSIIPFTYQNTNFQYLKTGDNVNIEFDIIGKYISKTLEKH